MSSSPIDPTIKKPKHICFVFLCIIYVRYGLGRGIFVSGVYSFTDNYSEAHFKRHSATELIRR